MKAFPKRVADRVEKHGDADGGERDRKQRGQEKRK